MANMVSSDVGPAPDIDGRAGFVAALIWAVSAAASTDARKMWWVDPDFSDWPLNDAVLLTSLAGWLQQPQRKLVLLATDYGPMERLHPRFVTWRRTWGHAIEPYSLPEDEGLVLPTLAVVGPHACVELLDRTYWRGRAGIDPQHTRLLADEIDALVQRSSADFPVTRLGL